MSRNAVDRMEILLVEDNLEDGRACPVSHSMMGMT